MRIVDSNQPAGSSPAQSGRTDATRPADSTVPSTGGTGNAPSSDSVQLSGFSGKIAQSLQSDEAARAEKVNQLAAAVQSGNYQINPKAVSHAIVNNALGVSDSDQDGDSK
jgi:flagellar biosynthesis anti-sigma factor FlgM